MSLNAYIEWIPHDVISFILKNNQTKSLNKRTIGLIGIITAL